MADYIPWNDAELKAWLGNFSARIDIVKATFGLTDADIAPLIEERSAFEEAFMEHVRMRNAAQAATANKRNCREAVVQTIRRLSRQVDNHTAMTNGIRASLGLNLKSDTYSKSSVGDEVPGMYLTYAPGQVIVHFGDSPANELTNGKPSWARGCNIYRKADEEEKFQLVAFEISSPYLDEITGPPTSYTYVVRYRGQKAKDLGAGSPPSRIVAGGLMAA